MKGITVETLIRITGGRLVGRDDSRGREASCVVIDSRKIEKDGVFIATVGEKVDSHCFIPAVFEAGALAVVCEKEPETAAGPCIVVPDSFKALTAIAAYYRSMLDIPIVGITGSVGKTSTKELISSVLKKKYRVLNTEGNFNNEIGVPLTILRIRPEHECAVVEMGINHFGEMTRLSAVARPDVAVITNIGSCHLEALGDRDGVLKAKTEIFENMKADGCVVLNGDDDKLDTVREVPGKKIIRYAKDSGADVSVKVLKDRGLSGSDISVRLAGGESFETAIALPGAHMVLNAGAAAAVGELLGLDAKEIAEGIAGTKSMAGRNNVIEAGGLTVIDDCYNANPTSVRASLDLLAGMEGERTALLGDMYELGADEKELHYDTGAYAVGKNIDRLICVGPISKAMYEGAVAADKEGRCRISHYPDKDSLKEALMKERPEGTVLVKASHGLHLEEIVEFLKEGYRQ